MPVECNICIDIPDSRLKNSFLWIGFGTDPSNAAPEWQARSEERKHKDRRWPVHSRGLLAGADSQSKCNRQPIEHTP